jgi:hypothetical protein
MPDRNILEVIHSLSEDKTFPPTHNLAQIARIAKGFAPMLTEVLEDYIAQNTGSGIAYRITRVKAAKKILGVRSRESGPTSASRSERTPANATY